MGSPFKMKPKSPFMKALVGKQRNLPQHLQDAIKAAPESPAKSYGKSPMKKTGKPIDVDVPEVPTKVTVTKGKSKLHKGVDETTTKKEETIKRVVPRSGGDKSPSERKQEEIVAARKGGGRIGTRTTTTRDPKGIAGTTQTRTVLSGTSGSRKDGTGFVKEATISKIKKQGPKTVKLAGEKLTKDKLGKSPAKMTGGKKFKKSSSKSTKPLTPAQKKAMVTKLKAKGLGTSGATAKKKKETRGQKVYREAMERVAAQKANAAKRAKEGPKKGVRVKMGMGTSLKTYRVGGKK